MVNHDNDISDQMYDSGCCHNNQATLGTTDCNILSHLGTGNIDQRCLSGVTEPLWGEGMYMYDPSNRDILKDGHASAIHFPYR